MDAQAPRTRPTAAQRSRRDSSRRASGTLLFAGLGGRFAQDTGDDDGRSTRDSRMVLRAGSCSHLLAWPRPVRDPGSAASAPACAEWRSPARASSTRRPAPAPISAARSCAAVTIASASLDAASRRSRAAISACSSAASTNASVDDPIRAYLVRSAEQTGLPTHSVRETTSLARLRRPELLGRSAHLVRCSYRPSRGKGQQASTFDPTTKSSPGACRPGPGPGGYGPDWCLISRGLGTFATPRRTSLDIRWPRWSDHRSPTR